MRALRSAPRDLRAFPLTLTYMEVDSPDKWPSGSWLKPESQ